MNSLGFLPKSSTRPRARLSEARPIDALKAAEMLAKDLWVDEPERINVQSVEGKGRRRPYGAATRSCAIRMGEPRRLEASVAVNSEANGTS